MSSLNRSLPFTAAALLFSVLGLAMPMRASAALAPVDPGYSVSPNPTLENSPFILYLNGVAANCNTVFARESVTVIGKTIHLSFVANTIVVDPPIPLLQKEAAPAAPITTPILCPIYTQLQDTANIMIPLPYYGRPAFSMPPLAAGTYDVIVSQLYECMFSTPSCKIAVREDSAGTLTVEPVAREPYTITPTSTAADQGFDLTLLSYAFTCGTYFDSLTVTVKGNEITLGFLDHQRIGVACPAIYKPYGPTFKMPALKAGTYTVFGYRMPACYPCKMLGETLPAGTLTVQGRVVKKGWFLKQRIVPPDNPFTLDLLNNAYGNCQTSFSHQSISTSGNNIYASFLVEAHPERVCVANITPFGPSFDMQALKMGYYPVSAIELLPCEVTAPFCAIRRIVPVPFDTLIVAETLSMRLSELRANAPKVEMHGSRASFLLPAGIGGTWKAELVTVSGRHLVSASMSGEGGSRVEMDLGADVKTGVYLLRLQAPDGESHLLPIVR